ncbi:uncharacterized protein LOC112900747 [Panicum hallii]|uniref:uncharacterized protein LOC112900747 n=1 Tax=Panicum hallii TaxID=206008 RepID=UPI000DF4D061|nr:uncharacterized protein LOC112900747 [Panicum hallii]
MHVRSEPASCLDRAKRFNHAAAGRRRPAADLPEDVHAEILVRLPAESVLRFRSVCKAWHRITSDPRFLTAHARRRPAQVVLYRYLESTGCKNRPLGYAVDIALDVLPVSGEEEAGRRRRLIGYPRFVTTTDPPERWRVDMPVHCLLLDTCDGVSSATPSQGSGPSSRGSPSRPTAPPPASELESTASTSTGRPASSGSCAVRSPAARRRGASSPPAPPSPGNTARTTSWWSTKATCAAPRRWHPWPSTTACTGRPAGPRRVRAGGDGDGGFRHAVGEVPRDGGAAGSHHRGAAADEAVVRHGRAPRGSRLRGGGARRPLVPRRLWRREVGAPPPSCGEKQSEVQG